MNLSDFLLGCAVGQACPTARRELRRRQIAKRTVRAPLVVLTPPDADAHPRIGKAGEPVLVQTLIPELPVEGLHESVLRGLARLDQFELDTIPVRPLVERLAGEFRSLVSTDRPGRPRKSAACSSTRTTYSPVML